MQVECWTKNIFAIGCLGRKLVFHTETFEFRVLGILKIGLFHRVKELSKSIQTRYVVFHVYLESKTKKM